MGNTWEGEATQEAGKTRCRTSMVIKSKALVVRTRTAGVGAEKSTVRRPLGGLWQKHWGTRGRESKGDERPRDKKWMFSLGRKSFML